MINAVSITEYMVRTKIMPIPRVNCDINGRSVQNVCKCNPGYAGNGVICGSDSDSDGFPDIGLNCNEPSCLMDNCPDFPNSGH